MDIAVDSTAIKERSDDNAELHRTLTWVDAFWLSSGVPAYVLFTIGAVAATVGNLSWVVWIASISIGFIQCFTYAEIAALFPHKSGGASVYGAMAWVRYGKMLAPISVWCNWLAWSPVLALGTSLGAGYMLSVLFPADSVVNTWQMTLVDLNWLRKDLTIRLNVTAIIGALLMLGVFAVQHRGILQAARLQMIFAISSLVPLLAVGVIPIITGDLPQANFLPLVPLVKDASGQLVQGEWNMVGFTTLMAGMFLCGYSTYGFETAVCYTREFRDPSRDTFRAIFSSGLLCLAVITLVPVAFQGVLGLNGLLAPDIYSGMGVGRAMAAMVGATGMLANLIVIALILTILLSIMTAMAGSSRTLYQGSVDGWLPRYLSHVNEHGAPTRAMWTDLVFNLLLLLMSDNVFVLAASNVCYITFIFMNLNAGWIHRMDRPNQARPFRAPTWLLITGALLGYLNLVFLGFGADSYGAGTLFTGFAAAAMIIPVFLWRHYVTDKGVFPPTMQADLHLEGGKTRAGALPYLALVAAVLLIAVCYTLSQPA